MKKTHSKDPLDPLLGADFLGKASRATNKIITTITKSFDAEKLEKEFNTESSETEEHKIAHFNSKLPQLIELLSFKALEYKTI